MRTKDELVQYLRDNDYFLGFGIEALSPFLDYERAKEFLSDEFSRGDFEKIALPHTREWLEKELKTYMMEYGINKAVGHRGISAGRTIEKLKAWLYALGEDELFAFLKNDANYAQYGVPMLVKVCERYDIKQPDTDRWRNMALGIKCRPDCDGCGV